MDSSHWTAKPPVGIFPLWKDLENGLAQFCIAPYYLGSIADEEESHPEGKFSPSTIAKQGEAKAIRLLGTKVSPKRVQLEFPHLGLAYIRRIIHGEARSEMPRRRVSSQTRGRKTVKVELKAAPEIKGGKVFRSGKRSANNAKLV